MVINFIFSIILKFIKLRKIIENIKICMDLFVSCILNGDFLMYRIFIYV